MRSGDGQQWRNFELDDSEFGDTRFFKLERAIRFEHHGKHAWTGGIGCGEYGN